MALRFNIVLSLKSKLEGLEADLAKVDRSASKVNKTFRSLQSQVAATVAALFGLRAIQKGFDQIVSSARDFESSFAGVRKTVDATELEFRVLSAAFRQMSKEIPLSVNEINRIGEAAGQLGIRTENIVSFSRVMADLGVATNMSSEQAATALARLANITQMPQENFERLGSTIVALGNNFATTESEIVEMSLRIAGAGRQLGLTEGQVLAISTALSSVGIEAQAGGSAISRVMINVARSVSQGSDDLAQFAAVADMSVAEFSHAFRTDAAGALNSFITGMARMQEAGGDTIKLLDDLGINEIRMADALRRAAGAGDVLTRALDLQAVAWEENTALANEAEQRYGTFESRMVIFRNKVNDLLITIGQHLTPVLGELAETFASAFDAGDAARWGESLAKGAQRVARVLKLLIDNVDTLVSAVKLLVLIRVASWGTEVATSFAAMAVKAKNAAGATSVLQGALIALQGAAGKARVALLGVASAATMMVAAIGFGINEIIKSWGEAEARQTEFEVRMAQSLGAVSAQWRTLNAVVKEHGDITAEQAQTAFASFRGGMAQLQSLRSEIAALESKIADGGPEAEFVHGQRLKQLRNEVAKAEGPLRLLGDLLLQFPDRLRGVGAASNGTAQELEKLGDGGVAAAAASKKAAAELRQLALSARDVLERLKLQNREVREVREAQETLTGAHAAGLITTRNLVLGMAQLNDQLVEASRSEADRKLRAMLKEMKMLVPEARLLADTVERLSRVEDALDRLIPDRAELRDLSEMRDILEAALAAAQGFRKVEIQEALRNLQRAENAVALDKARQKWGPALQEIVGRTGEIGDRWRDVGQGISQAVDGMLQFRNATDDAWGKVSGIATAFEGIAIAINGIKGNYAAEGGAIGAVIGAIIGFFAGGNVAAGAAIGGAAGSGLGSFINKGAPQGGVDRNFVTGQGGFHLSYGGRGAGEVQAAAGDIADQVTDVLMSILDMVGGNLEYAAGLRIDVRAGEWVKITVGAVERYFKDTTDAVRFAINEILQTALVTDIDEALQQMLRNADFTSFEEMERGLNLVTGLIDGYAMTVEGMSSLEVEMRKMPQTLQALRRNLESFGLAADQVERLVGGAAVGMFQTWREQITGEGMSQEAKRQQQRAQAELYNAQLELYRAELKSKLAYLEAQLKIQQAGLTAEEQVILGQIEAVDALGKINAAEMESVSDYLDAKQQSARALGEINNAELAMLSKSIEAHVQLVAGGAQILQAQIDAIRKILDSLPGLINISNLKLPSISGVGGVKLPKVNTGSIGGGSGMSLRDRWDALFGQLFPNEARMRELRQQADLVRQAYESGLIPAGRYTEALRIIREQMEMLAGAELRARIQQTVDAMTEGLRAQEQKIQELRSAIASLKTFRDGLLVGNLSALPMRGQLDLQEQRLRELAQKAALGDVGAMGQVQGAATQYLQLLSAVFGTGGAGYQSGFRLVQQLLGDAITGGEEVLDTQTQKLVEMRDQLAAILEAHQTLVGITAEQLAEIRRIGEVEEEQRGDMNDRLDDLARQIAALADAVQRAA